MVSQELLERLADADPDFCSFLTEIEGIKYFKFFLKKDSLEFKVYSASTLNPLHCTKHEILLLIDAIEHRVITFGAAEQFAIGKKFNKKWAINYCHWEEKERGQCHQYIIYKNVEFDLDDEEDDDEIGINIGIGNIADNKLESLIYAYCTALERTKKNNENLSNIS